MVELQLEQVSLTNNGLNNGGNRIINVAAGTNKTDAVNVGQLNAAKTELENGTNTTVSNRIGANGQTIYKIDTDFSSIADAIGGNTKFEPTTGKIDTSVANVGGTGKNNVSNAVAVARTTVSSNDNSVTINKTTTSDRHFNYDLKIDTSSISAGTNLAYKANGSNNQVTTLSNGLDFKNGDNTVATVGANGEIKYSVNPTMTGINSITTAGGGTTINNNGIEITGGPSVTSSGIDAGGKKITNIAEGDINLTSNDAVTGRQVYNAISAGGTDKATRAELAGVNNNLTARIAGVAAMANLPQINDSASNRFNIAVAGGTYKNGRAMALGFSGVSDGGRFVYRASASLNNKRDVAVGLGVGYQFGKRDVMPNELDRMKSMVALIEEQKDSYSRQLKQQLEQESRKN